MPLDPEDRRLDAHAAEPALEGPDGFTWIEVMIAILLLAVGLLALAPVFLAAARSSATASDLDLVGARAARRMEVLREIPFDALSAGGDLGSDASGFFDGSDPACLMRWTIADDAAPPSRKTITVLARALHRGGPAGQVQLTMVRAR
jgi:prepilin-type N-terminal cleavage/methylation domain-containing protein